MDATILKDKESTTLEAKSAANGLPRNIWETYSAFANTDGGEIILGVSEYTETGNLKVSGVGNPEHIKKVFWDIINNHAKVSKNILSDSDFNEIGKNGGSKNLQSHNHKVLQKNRSGNEYQVVGSYAPSGGSYLSILATNGAATYDDAINYQIYTTTEGTGNAGNLQPYEVVAFWKRVA